MALHLSRTGGSFENMRAGKMEEWKTVRKRKWLPLKHQIKPLVFQSIYLHGYRITMHLVV
jgi:hypothetical protein